LLLLLLLNQWPRYLLCQSCPDTRHFDQCTPSFFGPNGRHQRQAIACEATIIFRATFHDAHAPVLLRKYNPLKRAD
jgi:hypothetical protein